MIIDDPYRPFRGSTTAFGLYARKRWLGEGYSIAYRADVTRFVKALLSAQRPDGSWNGSVIETARALFALHLVVRDRTPACSKALCWMFDSDPDVLPVDDTASADRARAFPRPLPDADVAMLESSRDAIVATLPFVPCEPCAFAASTAMFLAGVFGYHQEPVIALFFAWWERNVLFPDADHATDISVTSNMARAFIVLPELATSAITSRLVDRLATMQCEDGSWQAPLDSWQVFNALAHTPLPAARRQCERALPWILAARDPGGTWGASGQVSISTFLVVHALRNLGLLVS